MKPQQKKMPPLYLEDVEILFKNFSGKEGMYNAAGQKNFSVLFRDLDVARQLENDGWTMRYWTPKDSDVELAHLAVKIKYNEPPPRVFMLRASGKLALDESTVEMLDWVKVTAVDVVLNPHHYDVHGTTGVTAYLKTMYATIFEDQFDLKHADVPEIRVGTP